MIEFNGCLSGPARNFFIKRTIGSDLLLFLISGVPVFLFALYFCELINNYNYIFVPVIGYVLIIIYFIAFRFSNSIKSWIPNKVCIEKNRIISFCDKNIEYQKTIDVKAVYAYEEFYFIAFPFGKIRYNYICQKNNLSKGTIDEFEKMFKDKIIKKA